MKRGQHVKVKGVLLEIKACSASYTSHGDAVGLVHAEHIYHVDLGLTVYRYCPGVERS